MKIFLVFRMAFSTSSEAHGWIPQAFLSPKMYLVLRLKGLQGPRLTVLSFPSKFPFFKCRFHPILQITLCQQ